MVNNFIQVLLVPEIALAILTGMCLLYGLFSKKNSYVRTTNLALISLMLIPFLVFLIPRQILLIIMNYLQIHLLYNFSKY